MEIQACYFKDDILQDKHYVPLTESVGLAIESR